MRAWAAALVGAFAWLALTETQSPGSALFGGALAFWLARLILPRPASKKAWQRLPAKGWAMVRLTFRFATELVIANMQQLRLVFSPRLRLRPEWVTYRTRISSPRLRTVLGLMISLTPGTVTADLCEDRLLLHLLDAPDPKAVTSRIRDRFESLLLELDSW